MRISPAMRPGLHEGQVVQAGDPLGYVGDTGDAGAGQLPPPFRAHAYAPGERW